jgi:glyoxylase-like metal-dependent hydrolase (beta-lactamase superfamily II)
MGGAFRYSAALAFATSAALMLVAERVHTQAPSWAWAPPVPTVTRGKVEVFPVRGKVHMLAGAGGNITVHTGETGILVVDAGAADMTEQVWSAIQTISRRPLRYIVNTNEHEDYSGGNEALALKGSTIPFRPAEDARVSDGMRGIQKASIISYLTAFERMSAPTGKVAPRAEGAWPDNTYSTPQKKLPFNDEPIVIMHVPGTTDGHSIVYFRTSDVISVGDLVDMTAYPRIDIQAGGTADTVIEGLNRLIDLTVPNRKSEAGTLVIPGRGRIADQPDVVYYQQMVSIVRDRVKDMVSRGMTLDQIKAARPSRDYDARWGADSGPWTTSMFIEAVYAGLAKKQGGEVR